MPAKGKRREVVFLPVDDLADNWWNPNSEKAEKFNALFDSVMEFGIIENIQVVPICQELMDAFEDEEDRTQLKALMDQRKKWLVLQGSHRLKAAQTAGKDVFPEIPCIVLEPKDVDKLKGLSVRMNVIRGEIDPVKFMKLWQQMADKGYSELMRMDMLGVTSKKELDGLIKSVRKDMDPELRQAFDAHREEIKTIEDLSRVLNELFTKYGSDLAYSFMTFTWGGKTHTFIRLNKDASVMLARLKEFCRQHKVDVNDALLFGWRATLEASDQQWPEPKEADLSIVE